MPLEGEAAPGIVELRAGDAEVDQSTVHLRDATAREHRRGIAEVGVLRDEAIAVLGEARPRRVESAGILIEPDHACPRLEQRRGVPAASEGSVEEQLAGIRGEEFHRLSQEHWPMRELHGLLIACASPG